MGHSPLHGTVIEREPQEVDTGPPAMYEVSLLNDDFTPMDFVVLVLQQFFQKNREQAIQIMLKVHNAGRGVCGKFPKEVAEMKVNQVVAFAHEHEHPLQCVMEESQ